MFRRVLSALRTQSPIAANHRRPGSHSGPPILIFVVVLQRCARIAAALASRHHLNGFEIIRESRTVIFNGPPKKSVRRPSPPSTPLTQSPNSFINLGGGFCLRHPLLAHRLVSPVAANRKRWRSSWIFCSLQLRDDFGGLNCRVAPVAHRAG